MKELVISAFDKEKAHASRLLLQILWDYIDPSNSRRGSMDVLEEELLEINRDQMFPEEEEEKFAMRSKSVSLAGSTTELHTLSRARSGEDLRSDEEEVSCPQWLCPPFQ